MAGADSAVTSTAVLRGSRMVANLLTTESDTQCTLGMVAAKLLEESSSITDEIWIVLQLWEQRVVSSNPTAPTIKHLR